MPMNNYYEQSRDQDTRLTVQRNQASGYPMHFHAPMEIFLVREGGYRLTINGESYEMTAGSIALIDSYDIHGYEKTDGGHQDECVLIIPYAYLKRFHVPHRNMRIAHPVIQNATLCDMVIRLVDEYLPAGETLFAEEAVVDLILALLSSRFVYTESKVSNEVALMREILTFLHTNFRGDCSRKHIAHVLGYTEAHISRVFHRYLGQGLSEYVNLIRLHHIDRLRREGDERTTLDLIYEAGFKSQQTYYRARRDSGHKEEA